MSEATKTEPVVTTVTDKAVENAPEGAKELNAFQKFFTDLLNGKKEETPTPDEAQKSDEKPKTATKTYTEEEFTAAIEAEKQKLITEAAEQERLSKLSPEEKAKAMEQSAVAAAQTENTRLLAELTKRDLKAEAIASLSKDGFPVDIAELLDYTDKKSMETSFSKAVEIFKKSIEQGVNDKLRGKTPLGLGGAANAENVLKDQIAKNIRGGLM